MRHMSSNNDGDDPSTDSSTKVKFFELDDAFEDDGAAERWIDLLSDEESREATSWGRELHRALKHGDLETIAV